MSVRKVDPMLDSAHSAPRFKNRRRRTDHGRPPDGEVLTWRVIAVSAAPAVVIALVVLLPFLGKAFSVDDVTFLLQANHVLQDPLHPTAFDMVFHGVPTRLSSQLVSGPVMAWLLVPAVLAGGAEWIAHLIQAVFLGAGAVATVALGLRLGLDRLQAGIAGLLLVVSPGVIAMAATAMPDVNGMTFAAAGMERLVAWRQQGKWTAALWASLFLALAVLSRPHLLLVFAAGALLLLDDNGRPAERWRWRWKNVPLYQRAAPFALALAALVVVNYVMRDPRSGNDIAQATLSRMSYAGFWPNLANFPLQWALSFPLVLLWPCVGPRRFLRSRWALAGLVLGLLLAIASKPPAWDGWTFPCIVLVALGTAVLADIVGDAWARRDMTQMALGVWLLIAVSAAPYTQLPAKYLVPSAPAMAILIARQVRTDEGRRSMQAAVLCLVGVTALLLGILIIRADAALAQIGREGGAVTADEVARGGQVWMDGAWGFQWYAMKAGAKPMTVSPPHPQRGDVVVVGLQGVLAQSILTKTLVERRVFVEPGGRVLSREAHAGFFSNPWGPLPWSWGHDELGRIEVWRIGR